MINWISRIVSIGAVFQIIAIRGPIKMMVKYPEYMLILLCVAIFWGTIGYFLFRSANLMKEPPSLRKGSWMALIFSIFGLNFLSLIGAIAGLIQSRKKIVD